MTEQQIIALIVKAELGSALTIEEQYQLAHELVLARNKLKDARYEIMQLRPSTSNV